MLSSNTLFTPERASGMMGSFMARRGRRTIISQLLLTLSDRLLSAAQAETLSNSPDMVCECEAGREAPLLSAGTKTLRAKVQTREHSIVQHAWSTCYVCDATLTRLLYDWQLACACNDITGFRSRLHSMNAMSSACNLNHAFMQSSLSTPTGGGGHDEGSRCEVEKNKVASYEPTTKAFKTVVFSIIS